MWILFHYLLHPLNHLFSFQKVLYFFSIPAKIVDTKAPLFFYYILKFLDQHIHIHHHHICYFDFLIFCHLIVNHFQIILIVHHFQRGLHLLHHSNHLLLPHNLLLIFWYFSYHFCRVDCLFSFIYYIFYQFPNKKGVYFFHLECSYCPNRNGPQTHQNHAYQKSTHQGHRMNHLVNYKSPIGQKIHLELLESIWLLCIQDSKNCLNYDFFTFFNSYFFSVNLYALLGFIIFIFLVLVWADLRCQ